MNLDEAKLQYTTTHEWVHQEGDVASVGISRFAVEQLTDITYIELPSVGTKVTTGKSFGVIESVKAASDLYSPVTGEVIEVNQNVVNDPAMLSNDPYNKGWMVKVRTTAPLDTSRLKDKAAYDEQCASERH